MGKEFNRFTLNQRLQHIFLFVPFIILVLTGFPLKFPESKFWSVTFSFLGGINTARTLHRIAAVIMICDFIYHNLYVWFNIIRNRLGIKDLELLPDLKDLKDLIQNIKYFLFLSDKRPEFRKFSYVEKFDYWAVYWGMFIMAGSGLILWFPELWSNILPGQIIEIAHVAHSDEALLAFLAIIMWHFYNVHFNPGVWPMNKVWLTGKISEERMKHEHPLEYKKITGVSHEKGH